MSESTNNPLASLNLAGLKNIPQQTTENGVEIGANKGADAGIAEAITLESLAAAKTAEPDLGPLADLPGTWEGLGFNLIEIPNRNQDPTIPTPTDKFKLVLNATRESLTITEVPGKIINRGNAQGDIEYLSLHYLQQVVDVNLPDGENGIHLETGLFLNLPAGTKPIVEATIARLGSIPHGDSLLAQGTFFTVKGGPQFNIPPADPTPFRIVNGKRVNDTSDQYLSLLRTAVPPQGIPAEAIMNPNLILENAIKGQDIVETVVILLDANPIDGVNNSSAVGNVGGITNIPFVQVNANAATFTAIFWIEKIRNPDGSFMLQLQYTQTVILDFPVFGAPPENPITDIKWPHISVATLTLKSKQNS